MKELKYLNKYLSKYKYRLLSGILISVFSNLLKVQVPEIIKNSLNSVELYLSGNMQHFSEVKSALLKNILLIIGAAILAGFFTFLMRQLIIVTSRLIEFDLKNEIFKQYETLSVNFYKKNRTGDLMNRISEDVGKVRMYFGPAIMYSINMISLFVVVISKMLTINKTLTLYTLLPLPILSVSIYILSRIINKRSTIVQEYLSKLTTFSQENFSGINIIKSYGLEPKSITDFTTLSIESKDKNMHLFKAQALFFPAMILLVGVSNLMVIYIGGKQYINDEIDFGTIVEFILFVNMLTWPVAVVGWVTSMVQQAEASQKRINEFLKQDPEIVNTSTTNTNIHGSIVFNNVTFTYDDTKITALKNISFQIEKGDTFAIIGSTGAGKSTILELISRLYDINNGQILIDNMLIQDINLYDLRASIGFVPQDAFLFSDSIENNIRFGNESASEEKIIEAAKNAYIHKNIIQFKKGYKTLVGERGVTLSGGQKQRVSIARALVKEPEILIFDDCLSAVDTETEEIILSNLQKVSTSKTTIIVSHRISSVKHANIIIVMDKGEIIQQGNHQELISKEGYYQELYKQQLLDKKS